MLPHFGEDGPEYKNLAASKVAAETPEAKTGAVGVGGVAEAVAEDADVAEAVASISTRVF